MFIIIIEPGDVALILCLPKFESVTMINDTSLAYIGASSALVFGTISLAIF
jgi:hypothetical protein